MSIMCKSFVIKMSSLEEYIDVYTYYNFPTHIGIYRAHNWF